MMKMIKPWPLGRRLLALRTGSPITSSRTMTNNTARTAARRRRIIHLNHAGASPLPQDVLDCMSAYQQLEQQLGGYAAAAQRNEQLQQVYKDAATLIHASHPELEIALVESATVAWTRLFYSFCAAQQQQQQERNDATTTTTRNKKKKIILVSEADYAANLVAACQWARTHKGGSEGEGEEWSVLALPSVTLNDDDPEEEETTTTRRRRRRSTGKVNLHVLETMLSGKYIYQNRNNESGGDGDGVLLDPTSIALVCITHIPTNSGIVNPVYEVGNMIAKFNDKHAGGKNGHGNHHHHHHHHHGSSLPSILYLVDACQSIGQIHVNVQEMKCHGRVATGRKYLRGPRGTGFLYVPASIVMDRDNNCNIWPHHVDHYSVPIRAVPDSKYVVGDGDGDGVDPNDETTTTTTTTTLVGAPETSAVAVAVVPVPVESFLDFTPRKGATRFEFWESNIGNKLGLGVALQHALDDNVNMANSTTNMTQRQQQTLSVAMYLYHKLQQLDGIHLYYKPECGIVTFWIHGFDSSEIKRFLSQPGNSSCDDDETCIIFEVSVVPATSTPLDSARTGVPDLLRASVSYTSTTAEVDLFCERLESIINVLEKK